jgi:integrase
LKLKNFAPDYMRLAKLKPAYRKVKQHILDTEILPRFGEQEMHEISLIQIDMWIAEMRERDLAASSINNYTCVLRNMFRRAMRYNYVQSIPMIERERAKESDEPFLTYDQLDLALSKLREKYPEWATFYGLAANTGLRVGELRALRWADVDLSETTPRLHVRHNYSDNELTTPKGHKSRIVPLNRTARTLLKGLHRGTKASLPGGGHVFGQPGPVSYKAAYLRCLWLRTELKLDWIGTHTFRHTFASHLAMSGKVTILEIRDLLGHVDVRVTMRYAKLLPSILSKAVSALDR